MLLSFFTCYSQLRSKLPMKLKACYSQETNFLTLQFLELFELLEIVCGRNIIVVAVDVVIDAKSRL